MARGSNDLTAFGTLLQPQEAQQPILARPARRALTAWLTEIWAEAELTAVGLAPRRRALFDGPPGVGKTTLAHHLAARLGLPMLAVHPERIIDKWLGSTGRNIGDLFAAVAEWPQPVLLFLDEFDAIAVQRRAADSGTDEERNAYVNVLLQRLERHPGFVVAATNHGRHIDPAIWRRFDMQMELALPGQEERERILARYLHPYGLPAGPRRMLGEAFATAAPALMRQWCESVKRNIVLGDRLGWDMRKTAVVDRIIGTVVPHPDLGKPRLWSLGSRDDAVAALPWPLPLAAELSESEAPEPAAGGNIVRLKGPGA